MKKLKFFVMAIVLIATVAVTNVSAGTWGFADLTIPQAGTNAKYFTKTYDTGETDVQFKLTDGKPRNVMVWTYNRDMTTLYAPAVTAREGGIKKTSTYISTQGKWAGTQIALVYRDETMGFGWFSTSAYFNYH